MKFKCPTRGKVFEIGLAELERETGRARPVPFCSERCKLVDLGGWLAGEYRIGAGPDAQDQDKTEDVQ